MYSFDNIINRRGTSCVKYDRLNETFGRTDLLPMWIADMDFQSPSVVVEAAKKCCEHGIFGYTFRSQNAENAFINWVDVRHGWKVKREWLSSSPGVVTALALSVRAFTQSGDKILILTPVYPPFFAVIQESNRQLVECSLRIKETRYEINWIDFENKLKSGVKLFILSNLHNPVGRVWTKEELQQMGELCCRYGVKIISDEIHSDLALFENKHTVMASVSEEIANITLTAMAPSKTFNIAGMMNSIIISSSQEMLNLYNKELLSMHLETGNIFGHVTMEAAYLHGGEWLDSVRAYLERNINFVIDYAERELPYLKVYKPEGSFLLWIDFSGTGMPHEDVSKRLVNAAQVGLNDGLTFGAGGRGFQRMNIGCPKDVIEVALERIRHGFNDM